MIRIGSDTDIGMNRNSSDWLEMNSYPIPLDTEIYNTVDHFAPSTNISYYKILYVIRKNNVFL